MRKRNTKLKLTQRRELWRQTGGVTQLRCYCYNKIAFYLYKERKSQKENEMEINKIREIAKNFVDMPIHDTGVDEVASHPFANTWEVDIDDKNGRINSIDLRKEENQKKWRKQIKATIDESNLMRICFMMNPPYILTFISCIESLLFDEELGLILGLYWPMIEDITGDKNVRGNEIIKWFKRADKKILMVEEERRVYESLPEEVTIYRGVTSYNQKKKKALSWSLSHETAVWFANRFATGTGEVWKMTVPKKRIYCYFIRRGEEEVIVNLYGYKGEMEIEKL